ncbi:hypothetical protein EJ04DRAFT_458518 [Polyplosphaeria fusca]|uniref:Uncharacterized protein n=1 Tax=Polyplosphaeria fusca TaxID=682080 RepID=A0A9P4V793_9PLEO|nr:hypothetical protein EJ04DRAFT_458518 [Polyplosphaeria fusca]
MSSDAHQGGSLEDMAVSGTYIPGDAGQQRTIPSVPRPDQSDPSADYAHANPAHAADNTFDKPRSNQDRGPTAEVTTGTGDQLPSSIEKKRMDDADDPRAKGHDRYAKHARQNNPYDTMAGTDHGVEPAPGEEDMSQDALLDNRGAK